MDFQSTIKLRRATHLLEQSANIRYIQTILGYESSKRTEIKFDIEKITTPLSTCSIVRHNFKKRHH